MVPTGSLKMSNQRKINKFFRALAKVIKQPALLNLVLDQEDDHQQEMQKIKSLEHGFPELPFNAFLPDDGIKVEPFAFLEGGSLVTDLALIRLMALKINAQRYFEIGTWRGESVMQAAATVPECYTLNLSAEEMHRRNWNPDYIHLHGYFSKNNPRITHLEGDSRTFDFSNFNGKQDLVFVDGDHHFDSVVQDTQSAFKLVTPQSGVIIWHDYGHNPESVRWNVLHAIWKGTPEAQRKHLYTVSNTLSAMYYPYTDVPSGIRKYPAVPNPGFSVHLKKYKG